MKSNNKNSLVITTANKIIDQCVAIESLFKGKDVKVTVVVRPTNNPEDEMVIGNDDYEEVKKAVIRTQERERSNVTYD